VDDNILVDRFDSLAKEIGAVKDGMNRIEPQLATADQRRIAAAEIAEHRTTEAMREMQTEILGGTDAFARGNFVRMVRLETADASTCASPDFGDAPAAAAVSRFKGNRHPSLRLMGLPTFIVGRA